jgi:hypothetical protein
MGTEPNNGGENRTGIDWIWTNDSGRQLTAKSGVDRYARSLIKTDHDLLFKILTSILRLIRAVGNRKKGLSTIGLAESRLQGKTTKLSKMAYQNLPLIKSNSCRDK